MFGQNGRIRDHTLGERIMTALHTFRPQTVRDEPRRGRPPATADVHDRLDRPVRDDMFPDRGGDPMHINVGKAAQMLFVPRTTLIIIIIIIIITHTYRQPDRQTDIEPAS